MKAPYSPAYTQVTSASTQMVLGSLELNQLVEVVKRRVKLQHVPPQLQKVIEEQLDLYPNPLLAGMSFLVIPVPPIPFPLLLLFNLASLRKNLFLACLIPN